MFELSSLNSSANCIVSIRRTHSRVAKVKHASYVKFTWALKGWNLKREKKDSLDYSDMQQHFALTAKNCTWWKSFLGRAHPSCGSCSIMWNNFWLGLYVSDVMYHVSKLHTPSVLDFWQLGQKRYVLPRSDRSKSFNGCAIGCKY